MNPIKALIATGATTKTGTLSKTLQKRMGEANMYVRFGYVPLTILNHIRGQVSVSMNADIINLIHTSQQSTKEGLKEELKGYFRSIKATY